MILTKSDYFNIIIILISIVIETFTNSGFVRVKIGVIDNFLIKSNNIIDKILN